MTEIIFITALGVFAWNTLQNDDTHYAAMGRAVRSTCNIIGFWCNLLFFTAVLWSFFRFTWWHPIVIVLADIVLAPTLGFLLFRRFRFFALLAPILALVSLAVCIYIFFNFARFA